MSNGPLVSIVDDDPAFLDSISVLIRSMALEARAYSSDEDFRAGFRQDRPGCLLLDVCLPSVGGLAIHERLQRLPLRPPTIFLSGRPELSKVQSAFRQGALDFLCKSCAEFELREAVQRAIAVDLARREAYHQQEAILTRFAALSAAERNVLQLVLEGFPNKGIAAQLGVSRRAVEDRRARLMRKLGVGSLPELVRFAVSAEFARSA